MFYESDYVLVGVAFVLGLILADVPWGWGLLLSLGGLGAIWRWWGIGSSGWLSAPPLRVWLIATGVGLLAMLYLVIRVPQPSATDISRVIPRLQVLSANPIVQVVGEVQDMPLLNRSGKARFFLEAERYQLVSEQENSESLALKGTGMVSGKVSGKLYVTVPAAAAQEVHPSQIVAVTGRLYQPRGGSGSFYQVFDFRKFLAAQGAFAGLSGRQLEIRDRGSVWGLWAIRERIYQAQLRGLGTPEGPVLSAMVLGSRAVPIPFAISDAFRQVGLAHALAASGFQTSLILSVVISGGKRLPEWQKLILGGSTLLLFGALSGFAPSVMRSVFMGIAGLLALVGKQKARPVAMLLLIAIAMLLVNPLWIQDLGFQFSFLATLGLIVTAPAIAGYLSWLPWGLPELIAVPLAATIWVLPLQLAVFGVFPPYGLLANIVTTLLLSVITIGGFISALAAVAWPWLGTLVAGLMDLPTALLLGIIHLFGRLPGSSLAIGAVNFWQLLILYGLILAVWLLPWWQQRWRRAGVIAIALVLIPFLHRQTTGYQVTVLDTSRTPIMVIQSPGANVVINSGDAATAAQSLRSFLTLEGINQIDWAIATNRSSRSQGGWPEIQSQAPIRVFSEVPSASSDPAYRQMLQNLTPQVKQQPFSLGQVITLGTTTAKLLRADSTVLQLKIAQLHWLLITDPRGSAGHLVWLKSARLPQPDVLWWSGQQFSSGLLDLLKPKVLILSTPSLEPALLQQLKADKIPIFWTERDGAVRWTPRDQFVANLEASEAGS